MMVRHIMPLQLHILLIHLLVMNGMLILYVPHHMSKDHSFSTVLDPSKNIDDKLYIKDGTALQVCGTNNINMENVVANDVYHVLPD